MHYPSRKRKKCTWRCFRVQQGYNFLQSLGDQGWGCLLKVRRRGHLPYFSGPGGHPPRPQEQSCHPGPQGWDCHSSGPALEWPSKKNGFALLGFELALGPSSLTSFHFLPSEMRMFVLYLAHDVFWKHKTCLDSQVYGWRGILPEDE
jgi:hypothetical protein